MSELVLASASIVRESEPQILTVRRVLVVGKTGNGKSAIANVLLNKSNGPFLESEDADSCTEHCTIESHEDGGCSWIVADTIGFGDTKLSEEETLSRIANVSAALMDGIHCVLYVSHGRLTGDEKDAFLVLNQIMFTHDVPLVVVRTHFTRFQNADVVNRTRTKDVRIFNRDLGTRFTERDFLYVDNPIEDEVRRSASRNVLRTKILGMSRLYHLQDRETLLGKVRERVEEKNRKERELEEANENLRRQEDEIQRLEETNQRHTQEFRLAQVRMEEMERRQQEAVKSHGREMKALRDALAAAQKRQQVVVVKEKDGGWCSLM